VEEGKGGLGVQQMKKKKKENEVSIRKFQLLLQQMKYAIKREEKLIIHCVIEISRLIY